jgi:two-component system sensor histidine kinase AlgZ
VHPVLGRKRLLAPYLAMWVLVGGLLAAMLVALAGLRWPPALAASLPLAFVYAFVCLSAWYVSRGMPLDTTTAPRVVASALAAAVLSSIGWLVIARTWVGTLVGRGWIRPGRDDAGLEALIFGLGVVLYLLSLAVSYLLGTVEAAQETERRALHVQVLAREAELRALRAQIDPHFLFNSLQSISALTAADPGAARRMCLLLAEFLRESLALGSLDRITLARELKLVEGFLAVERVRFGERLTVSVDAGGAGECLVPLLLLQPLVENAVTHGIAHVLDGGTIRVTAARREGDLTLIVENPCDPARPRGRGAGVGVANVRARLAAVHGEEARLAASEQDGRWRVTLVLPAETAAIEETVRETVEQ